LHEAAFGFETHILSIRVATSAARVVSRDHTSTGRDALRSRRVSSLKAGTLSDESIYIRGFDIGVIVCGDRIEALLVGEEV
jgi:hypothetical protein